MKREKEEKTERKQPKHDSLDSMKDIYGLIVKNNQQGENINEKNIDENENQIWK